MQSGKARVTRVESVVFDIGRVLVRLDFRRILAYFSRHGLDTGGMDALLEQIESRIAQIRGGGATATPDATTAP